MAECDYEALRNNANVGGSEVYLQEYPVPFNKLVQNYSNAYYEYVTDKFFLMDPQQIVNMYNNEDILGSGYFHQYKSPGLLGSYPPYNYPYWIMAPYGSTRNFLLSLDNDLGTFYAQSATWIEVYARATFYLDPTEEFLGGSGTKENPYSYTLFSAGKGTEESPYEINSLDMLEKFRDKVNNGEDYAGDYFKLTADIDLFGKYGEGRGKSWTPIGTNGSSRSAKGVFNGTFDGNGKTIKGLYIGSEENAALFTTVGKDAVIKNLYVTGTVSVTGNNAAGICVTNQGTIEGCTVSGSIEGASHLGGICVYNYGKISRCINNGEAVGTGTHIGGVCAENRGTINDCYNLASLEGSEIVGGICGLNYSTGTSVKNCFDYGMLLNGEYIGCICGKNDNPIGVSACYYLDYPKTCEIGNGGCADGAIALQDSDFKEQSSFSGFDFENIWEMGNYYPVLRNVTEPNILHYFRDGYGTKAHPFELSTAAMLKEFRNSVNNGTDYRGVYVKLTADINLGNEAWTPIGVNTKKFEGNFDGGGHTISGFLQSINSNSAGYQGLFGNCDGCVIENVTVSGIIFIPANLKNTITAGGICGLNNNGIVRNCANDCEVRGNGSAIVGGICGILKDNAKIERCYNMEAVKCSGGFAGGIVGNISEKSSVTNCYNTGAVSNGSNASAKVGGICGFVGEGSEIKNSYSYGTVSFSHTATGTEGVYGGGTGSAQNSYYNTDAYTAANETMGKTAEQFKLQETFVGWDFDNVWNMSERHGRPTLKAIPEPDPPHVHDLSVECGHDDEITFDKALTSKDGKLYVNGRVIEPTNYGDDSEPYMETELPEGNYFLADDMELTCCIAILSTANICLNGHTMNIGQNSIATCSPRAVLNICDCGEGGTITGIHNFDANLDDAKITSYGKFTLYGGKVINTSDNTDADVKKYAISTHGGTANIFGGEVVSLNDNAVCIASDDEVKRPGLLYFGGAPKISGADNKADIYIANGGQGAGIIIDSPLTAKKPYRVAVDENNIFTYQWTEYMGDARFSDYFVSAAADKSIYKYGDELAIYGSGMHWHDMSVECEDDYPIVFYSTLSSKDGKLCIDGEVVEPTNYGDDSEPYMEIELPDGNYVLEEDIELACHIGIKSTVNLCLNGHIMDIGENSITPYGKGVLNICDCGENGTITGTHNSDPYIDAKIISCSNFYLYGGKVINTSDNTDPDVKKHAISTYDEGTAKIFGGEVVSLNDNAVYINTGDELYLAGAPKISGAADKADIYIDNSGDGAGIIIDAPLTAERPYRVATAENKIFTLHWTTYMGDARISDYFVSAVEDKSIKIEEDELVICDYEAIEDPSPSPSAPPLPTGEPSPSPSAPPLPTEEPSPSPSAPPLPTGEPSPSPSAPPLPTGEPSPSPSVPPLPTGEPSPSPSAPPLPTGEPSPSPSAPPLPTATPDPDENTECIKITAVYSDSGVLISVTIEKVMVSEITPEQNTKMRKIFYWESLESMKPIALDG